MVGTEEGRDRGVLRARGSLEVEVEGQGCEEDRGGGGWAEEWWERIVRDVHVRFLSSDDEFGFVRRRRRRGKGSCSNSAAGVAVGVLCLWDDRYVREDPSGVGERGGLDAVGWGFGECWRVVARTGGCS